MSLLTARLLWAVAVNWGCAGLTSASPNQVISAGRKSSEAVGAPKKVHPLKLTPAEERLVIETKQLIMDRRHRQIQGIIQKSGCYISASSVFKILQQHQLVEPFKRPKSPWKNPPYEVAKRHCIWGTDWIKLKINHETWHPLTLFLKRVLKRLRKPN